MDMIEESRHVYKRFVKHAASPDAPRITAAHRSDTCSTLQGSSTSQSPDKSPAPSMRDQPAQYCATDAAKPINLY
jgi:hypothetical protein